MRSVNYRVVLSLLTHYFPCVFYAFLFRNGRIHEEKQNRLWHRRETFLAQRLPSAVSPIRIPVHAPQSHKSGHLRQRKTGLSAKEARVCFKLGPEMALTQFDFSELWRKKYDCEVWSKNLGYHMPEVVHQREVDKTMRGPANIMLTNDARPDFLVKANRGFGYGMRFSESKKYKGPPPPGRALVLGLEVPSCFQHFRHLLQKDATALHCEAEEFL